MFYLDSVQSPFPSDFFEPIKAKEREAKTENKNFEYKPKSIYIDISKEDEEDKELLSLLEEKRKKKIF